MPTAEQVRWYRDTIESISDAEFGEDRAEDEVVASYIFNHVGVPEFKEAWDAAWNDGEPTEAYHYGHWMEGNYSSKYGRYARERTDLRRRKRAGQHQSHLHVPPSRQRLLGGL